MADQANFPDIYIDGSSAGDGSLASPYSDLSDVNWTTGGDNSIFDYLAGSPSVSPTIHLDKAVTWREKMTVGASGTAAYPIVVKSYGSGADPIISGFDVVSTWTQVAGAGDYAGDLIDDNFDDGNLNGWSTVGSPTASTDQSHNGSYSAKFDGDEDIYQAVAANGELWIAFWIYTGDATPTASQEILAINAGVSLEATLYIENDGSLAVWDADYLAAGATSLQDNTWAHIELRIKKGAGTGEIQVWLDEVQMVNSSTRDVGAADYDQVRVGSLNRSPNSTIYIDEVKVDSAGRIGMSGNTVYYSHAHTASEGGIVLEDGDPLTFCEWDTDVATSFGAASAGSFTFDGTGDIVYVWATDELDPDTHTMQVSVRDHAAEIAGKNYINIEDIDFTGGYLHGFHMTGTCSTLNFTSCDFYYSGGEYSGGVYLGNGFEVNGGASGVTLTSCKGHNNFDVGFSVQMLTGNGNMSDITLTQCEAYSNRMTGFEILSGSGTGTMSNVTVTRCIARNNDGTYWAGTHPNESGIYVDSYIAANMSNIDVTYNLIYENGLHGLYTLKNSTGAVPVEAYNNVIYDNGTGVQNTAALTFKNNIVEENTTKEMNCSSASITADYNRYYHSGGGTYFTYASSNYNFADWKTQSSQDANSSEGNPLMTNPGSDDFTLQVTSPCRSKGTVVGLTADYNGDVVPQGAVDIGAYEYPGGGALFFGSNF